MHKKPFMIIVLVILLAQPFVVVSSMPFAYFENITSPEKDIVVSQGTRLEGEDLTDHVPVLIDEEADFTSQGWPGAGTAGNPWIISGLNITYNVGQPCVEIRDVSSYFILRDCYVGQMSSQPGIYFENISHGTIEYLTIISPDLGIETFNANNTIVAHSSISADSNGVEIAYSHFTSIDSNLFDTQGLVVVYSNNVTISNNEIADVVGDGIYVNTCNYTMIESNRIDGTSSGVGIGVEAGYYVDIFSNSIENTADHGIYTDTEYTTIEENTILNAGADGIRFNTHLWISIIYNTINSTNYFSIHSLSADNGEILYNTLADDSNYVGIYLDGYGFENFTIADNYFEDLWGGFYTPGGRWINFYRNYATQMGFHMIYLVDSPDCNVVNNTVTDAGGYGVFTSSCDRLTVNGNTLNNTISDAIAADGANWTIQDNFLYNAGVGLGLSSSSVNADVSSNYFESFNTAISVSSDDVKVDSNTILDVDYGVRIQGSADEVDITNNYIESASTEGIYLTNVNMSAVGNTILDSGIGIHVVSAPDLEVEDNIIESCNYGILIESTTQASFINNNFTECSVYFPGSPSIGSVNHTFTGNNVNDKPLYYNIHQPGLSLDGNNYGEIILVNCSDASINGGVFTWSSVALEIFHSDRVDISDVHVIDNLEGIHIYMATNLTITDSIFEGRSNNDAINANNADGFYAENLTFTNIHNNAIRILTSTLIDIKDSHFKNIASSGISTNTVSYGLIEGNEIVNASWGIRLEFTVNTLISDNHLLWNMYGIYAASLSDANNATFNNIHDNTYGIRMDNCWTWYIYNNTVRWNDYGLYITTTNNNQWIYNNTFALNTVYNGYDTGADAWDDRVDGGNYWDDYGGIGSYNIPGASSVDHYPIYYIVTEPIVNTPADIWYAEGSEGNFITWMPYDDNLKDWIVTIDGGAWDSGIWNFENITVNVDGLAYGVHTVFVSVEDLYGNSVNDTVIVTVYDDTPPEIVGPPDTWLFEDASDQTITWDVSDLNPDDYVVYVDGVEYDTGSWTTGDLVIDFEGITAGIYQVVVTIYDMDGNSATDSLMFLMIKDDTSPVIDHPEDVVYIVGTTGNDVVWTPSDEFPASYVVTFNGTPYESDAWGGSRVAVNVDGMPVGVYELTITVYDKSGNSATDTVNVTVIPLIQEPEVPMIDWVLVIIIGAVIGAVIVVIAIVYYLKKKKGTT